MNTQKFCSFVILAVLFCPNVRCSAEELRAAIDDVNEGTAGFVKFVKAIELRDNDLQNHRENLNRLVTQKELENLLMQLKSRRDDLDKAYLLANRHLVCVRHGNGDVDSWLEVQNIETLRVALLKYDRIYRDAQCAKDIREGGRCCGQFKSQARWFFGSCMRDNLRVKDE